MHCTQQRLTPCGVRIAGCRPRHQADGLKSTAAGMRAVIGFKKLAAALQPYLANRELSTLCFFRLLFLRQWRQLSN